MGRNLRICNILVLLGLLFIAPQVFAATLSVTPSTGVYTAGGTFNVSVVLNTEGSPINAAEGQLRFNPKELSVTSVSRAASIFNLWTQEPTFSNSAGTISFGGGSPSGYTGSRGAVMSVTFRALNAGTAKVNFSDGSVLAADGLGTNVLTGMSGGTFTIGAQAVQPEPETIQYVAPPNTPGVPEIRSSTHPDPALWYQAGTAELSWQLPSGVTAVRTLLDGNSGSIPTKVYEPPITSLTIEDLAEGVSYFHLQYRNAEGWGRVAHYRLAVDSSDPKVFELSIPDGADLSNPIQTIEVLYEDDTSPLSRLIVQVDDSEAYEITELSSSSTFTLTELTPGRHSIIVEGFDAAGNSIVDTLSFSILAFDRPIFTDYPTDLNEGVIPVLKGLTRPNATVEVSLQKTSEDVAIKSTVEADGEGSFTFIPDGPLGLGVYRVTAVAFDANGAQSERSDEIRIAVQQPGYIQIGSLVLSVLSIIVPLIALVFLLVFIVWYSIFRFRRLRGAVSVESAEALQKLKSEFSELRAVLHNGETTLTESRKTKKLTKAEEDLLTLIHTELDDAESRVEKEITDITSLSKK